MSILNPQVEDDPRKPYKAYLGAVAAFLSSYLLTSATTLPGWAVGLITAAVAAIAVFSAPNPKVDNSVLDHTERGAVPQNTVIWILAVVGIVCLVLLLVGVLR